MQVIDVNGEPRYFGVYMATVTDNADPLKIGRVKLTIPGMIEPESGWSLPTDSRGGGKGGRGSHAPPPVGASVFAGFVGGDPDVTYYMPGWQGDSEQLSPLGLVSADDAGKHVQVHESSRFLIVLNEIGGSEELLIKDKETGDEISIKPDQLKIVASSKVTVVCPQIELGADGLGNLPLINGVVLGSGIDTFSGATYGALGSASSKVTATKM